MNFMENWDLFDENRNPLGQTHPRGIPLPEGCYHKVVFVWPVDRQGRFLLMRRAPEKKTYAGCWGSTGGSVLAGESGPAGAVRELFEETGICVSEDMLELIYSVRERDMFCDIYEKMLLGAAESAKEILGDAADVKNGLAELALFMAINASTAQFIASGAAKPLSPPAEEEKK